MERRHTIQKELVLHAVRNLMSHVTAEEVYQHIAAEHPTVGRGTVYRNLNILAEEGEIRKVAVPDGPDRFDFTLKEHHHVKCIRCGGIFDVDMEAVSGLIEQITDKHGFQFLDYDIFFRGICLDCQNQSKGEQHG